MIAAPAIKIPPNPRPNRIAHSNVINFSSNSLSMNEIKIKIPKTIASLNPTS
jgi:hypothetical protein